MIVLLPGIESKERIQRKKKYIYMHKVLAFVKLSEYLESSK